MSNNLLSIIIPTYNEEETILSVVKKVQELPFKKEIIVIDDGSTDKTGQIIENIKSECIVLKNKKNRGLGFSFLKGLKNASGRYVIRQDADLELDPKDILEIFKKMQTGAYDIVYGSRFLKKNENERTINDLGNYLFNKFISIFTKYKITDVQSCYSLMKTDYVRKLNLESERFELPAEIMAKAIRKRARISEVPIKYKKRSIEEGKKIRWYDGLNGFRIFILHLLRKQKDHE